MVFEIRRIVSHIVFCKSIMRPHFTEKNLFFKFIISDLISLYYISACIQVQLKRSSISFKQITRYVTGTMCTGLECSESRILRKTSALLSKLARVLCSTYRVYMPLTMYHVMRQTGRDKISESKYVVKMEASIFQKRQQLPTRLHTDNLRNQV